MKLTDDQIMELGRRTGREILDRDYGELVKESTQDEITLGMVVTAEAMRSPDLDEAQRLVPEDVDS